MQSNPSRLTNDLFSSTASTSSSSSILGKRGATEASLDLPGGSSSLRRSNGGMSTTTLQRRVAEYEAKERLWEEDMGKLKADNVKLRNERSILFKGEQDALDSGGEKSRAWAAEKTTLLAQLGELRSKHMAESNARAKLDSEHTILRHKYNAIDASWESDRKLLEDRVKELERELVDKKSVQSRLTAVTIELEETKRRYAAPQSEEDRRKDEKGDETVKQELRRQAQYLSTLERKHSGLQGELIELRQKKKDADAVERAAKETERALRDELRLLRDQLERARRDMDSLTQTFPSESSSPLPDAHTLQQRLSTLSTLHSEATAELAANKTEIVDLHTRLAILSADSKMAISETQRQLTEAERELRWAQDGRKSAETRERLARKEVEGLRSSGGSGPSTASATSSNQAGRVRELEALVESYKQELENIDRDSRQVEARLTQGAGLVKQTLYDDEVAKSERLQQDIERLRSDISDLSSANTSLDAEIRDLMQRVASGEYNQDRERCLELKDNPAARIRNVRMKELEDLARERDALLARLSETQAAGEVVPKESWDRIVKEKDDLERAHAKRLLRLKEIFGNKSKEFLEAVYSLLGWRIKFDESGADIRLTSMYAPKGKMGLTLKFASQEGHFGTMQMTGAMAKGLEDTRHFWIVERQSVPGFLAQVTTEMFEKTTIGRAAGYVGLE